MRVWGTVFFFYIVWHFLLFSSCTNSTVVVFSCTLKPVGFHFFFLWCFFWPWGALDSVTSSLFVWILNFLTIIFLSNMVTQTPQPVSWGFAAREASRVCDVIIWNLNFPPNVCLNFPTVKRGTNTHIALLLRNKNNIIFLVGQWQEIVWVHSATFFSLLFRGEFLNLYIPSVVMLMSMK